MYKYKKSVLFVFVLMLTILSSCSQKIIGDKSTTHYYYSCPMHTEVFEKLPGKCLKCGMTLEQYDIREYSNNRSNSEHSNHNSSNSSMSGHSGGCH